MNNPLKMSEEEKKKIRDQHDKLEKEEKKRKQDLLNGVELNKNKK